jgi:hypothetical protein
MAFPTTSVLDDFNRADGLLVDTGTNWSNDTFNYGAGSTALTIVSNVAAPTNASYGEAYWDVGTFGPDSEAYGTITTLPHEGGDMGLAICVQSPDTTGADGYRLIYKRLAGTDTVEIRRVDNGNNPGTLIGSITSQEIAAGDSLGLEKIGSTVAAYYKAAAGSWTLLTSGTDSTYGTGFIGLYSFSTGTNGRWDNFGGGTVVGGGGGSEGGGGQAARPGRHRGRFPAREPSWF